MRKGIFIFGIFVTLFGLASSTKEFLGCISLPIDGIFYLLGTTSHVALQPIMDVSKYVLMVGVTITVISLIFLQPHDKELKFELHFRKWNPWKRRRALFHFFVVCLILLHISLVVFGKSSMPSICPLSFAELGNSGIFGWSAVFWGAVFLLVLVFGRALCGWACVYTPVQEQAANVLTAVGKDPNRILNKRKWLLYALTALFWGSFAFNIYRNLDKLNFSFDNGLDVGNHWLFFSGLLTIFPITIFLTHYLGNRFFCKQLCPLGGTMSLYSRLGLLKIKIDADKCGSCTKCDKNCQMGVDISSFAKSNQSSVSDGNCIVCGDCIDHCPKGALKYSFGR